MTEKNIYAEIDPHEPAGTKTYSKNIYAQIEEEDEEEFVPTHKARDLMLNRGKAAYEGLSNLPESAGGLFKNLTRFLADPKSVIEAGIATGGQMADKVGRKTAELVQGQPLEVMPERQEVLADEAIKNTKERLGGGDELASTLITDPLGLGVDLGIAKPLRGLDPMSGISRTADAAGTAASRKMYGDAVGIPRTLPDERRGELIDTGMDVDNRVTANREGLDTLDAQMEVVGADINKIFDDMEANSDLLGGDRFDVSEINRHLDDLMRSYENTVGGEARIAKVNSLKKKLYKDFPARDADGNILRNPDGSPVLKPTLSAKELQKVKKDIYQQIYTRELDPSTKISKGTKTQVLSRQGRAAKEDLFRAYPELIDPNIQWGKYAQLKPMIERSMKNFTELQAGYVGKMLSNPEWRSKMAITLKRLSDGDISFNNKLISELGTADARILLVMLGRNEEMVNEFVED